MGMGMAGINPGMGGMNPGMGGINPGMGGINPGMVGMSPGMGGMNPMGMGGMNPMGMGGMNPMGMGGMNPMGMGGMNPMGMGGMNPMGMGGMNPMGMGGMNPMGMGGMSPGQIPNGTISIEDIQGWNLIFENQNDKKLVTIRISEQKTVKEAINVYLLKSGRTDKCKFIFNNKELYPEMIICQSGLQPLSRILVISTQNVIGAN